MEGYTTRNNSTVELSVYLVLFKRNGSFSMIDYHNE